MNDTERELRELFESKARDAGAAPPVTPDVLSRGRRRQLGTVAVAGITALAIAATAVVSLQALNRADTDSVPGGPNGNPAFTATIQNLTLTVPGGWTLIDQTPITALSPAGSVQHFSCVGAPVEAGGGETGGGRGSSDSGGDCVTRTESPSPIPVAPDGLPILQLSNFDPGLDGTLCDGTPLPPDGVAMFVAIDAQVLAQDAPTDALPWPVEMVNVTDDPGPGSSWPCGVGGYAWFQAGGIPYFVWGGFGSDFSDQDRATMLDSFHGMQVGDDTLGGPIGEAPAYVLAAGRTDSGSTWNIEVSPSSRNVDMRYSEVGGRGGGVGDFTVPDVPIEAGGGQAVVFGAVTFEADRVEVRPADGADPMPGSILQLPDSLGAPFDAFVAPNGAGGAVVAIGPDGDLGSTLVGPASPEPTLEDRRAQADLRNAYVAAKTYFVDTGSYEGFTPKEAAAIEPSLAFNTAATAISGEVSIRDAGSESIALVEVSGSGTALCIAEQPGGATTYGAVDAQLATECVGGEDAWGQEIAPTETPSADPAAANTVNLEGFPSPTTLWTGDGGGCLSIEIATESSGSAICIQMSHRAGTYATILRMRDSTGLLVLVGSTGAKNAERVFVEAADGTRTQAPTLYTLQSALDRQFFAFPVETSAGTLHIEDGNGNELTSPVSVREP